MTMRRRRSALYLPASNPHAIEKARGLECDVVIFDLEDGVAPDMKAVARDLALAALKKGGYGSRELVVRVNSLDTEWGVADMRAIVPAKTDAILIPKVDNASSISRYMELLGGTETKLWAMIETTQSIFNLEAIAAMGRTGPLAALVMGTNDLANEMGAQPDIMRTPFLGMLALTVAAARSHGLSVLDGVFNDIEDRNGLDLQLQQAVAFGFDGKTLIHPGQIKACNEVFTPGATAIASAQRIIAAFNSPENAELGAIRLDGRMVERLHLHQARRTIAAAGG